MTTTWLIYGANGYTGELIARHAVQRGHRPILAGRNGDAVNRLARELQLPSRIFSLSDVARDPQSHLRDVQLVVHAAGPFSQTAIPMLEACCAVRCHYFDITGEIQVFEEVFARAEAIRAAGICAIPGVGFDVVPSDVLANTLCRSLGEPPLTLDLAFRTTGRPSRGTTKTMIERLGMDTMVRRDGRLVSVPMGSLSRSIPGMGTGIAIPWGDVATAWRSTGCPNIRVFMPMPLNNRIALRLMGPAGPLLRHPKVRDWLTRRVEATMTGPSSTARTRARTDLWGEATGASGRVATGRLSCGDGYDVTAQTTVLCVERLQPGHHVGPLTPVQAFGAEYFLAGMSWQVT